MGIQLKWHSLAQDGKQIAKKTKNHNFFEKFFFNQTEIHINERSNITTKKTACSSKDTRKGYFGASVAI